MSILLMWQHAIEQELLKYITYGWYHAATFTMYLIACWLNLVTHLLLRLITYNLKAPIKSVMSGNICTLSGYLVYIVRSWDHV